MKKTGTAARIGSGIMPTSSGRGTTWYLVDTRSRLAD
jgi:hypothetical protein